MLRPDENVINRRNPKSDGDNERIVEPKEQLTLPEKILVLALNNGRTPFWNDNISTTLRGSILVELSFKGKICLEAQNTRNRLLTRKVIILDETLTGERILDETLKFIKNAESMNISMWMECLNGENWNPKNWKYQLKSVKDRLAKDLIEKGVLSMKKVTFLFIDSYTYPLIDDCIKEKISQDICLNLLERWTGNPGRMDRNILSLILMVYSADILETIVSKLSDSDYGIAKTRLYEIIEGKFEKLAERYPGNEVFWAVCEHLFK